MRRIFTFSIALASLLVVSNANSQTCTPVTTITAPNVYTFDANAQGFTGNFTHNNGPDNLQSSTVGTGTVKELNSVTLLVPNVLPNIEFGFTLSGNANVTGYTIEALYSAGGTITSTTLCTGGALANGTYNFSLATPAILLGERIQLQVTYTIAGATNQTILIDDFRTNLLESQIVLPVKFSTFEARTSFSNVNLVWNVGFEDGVSGYDVERSNDGKNFSRIGFVAASGQGSYSFATGKTIAPVTYYRIKSIDYNGQYVYSTVASIRGGKSSIVLKAFPMPAVADVTLQHGTAVRGSNISISTQDGRVVKSIVPAVGTQQTTLDFSSLRPGVYMIRFASIEGEVETLKVVKQ